ncbi:MAG: hypothetical protein JRH13_05100 [Deltaproteobacteria bacterium]|nr:hypothetical protein [Deltaproteobacteria bacterium]MBW2018184.1 hypothetical protein [Deltaproteobacteria bacterium]MBW2128721.1 hypothetical protein [Deltaproteobacteria bacterium]MBW2302397.1 hypothetical protein [Deltaproteobacteria bacterium]
MSAPLKNIARELYRLSQEVDRLESLLKTASPDEKERIEDQLRKARAEKDRIRKILDGHKEPPPYRKPR